MSHQDITDIIQVVNLYGFAVDSQQWDLFDRVFTADCHAYYSEPAQWHDLASFKRDFAAFHDPFDSTQHAMSTHIVNVDGDSATCFCNGSWRLIRKAADGVNHWDGTGWYEDDLVRTAGGWRISKRWCGITWWTGNPTVQETLPGVKFDLNTTVLRRRGLDGQLALLNALNAK